MRQDPAGLRWQDGEPITDADVAFQLVISGRREGAFTGLD